MMEWKIVPIHNKEGEISHHLAIQRDANWKPAGQDFAP
jgi:hypothetical protein